MSKENQEEHKEKRHYQSKKNSDIVNFPILFRRSALSPSNNKDILDAPICTIRILFKVLNDISNDQFQAEKQVGQLALFEEEFMTENNTFGRFTFKVEDIDKNKDYNALRQGLEFLEGLEKGWHKAKNSKGKIIKSYGGVISTPTISEGKISFLMSSFWIGKILSLGVYNPAFFETPWQLSKTKQALFYLWLLELKEHGTKVNFNRFQESYGYSYPSAQIFAKNVLKSLKTKLDKYSNVSFNYSTKGDMINIVPYFTKDVELQLSESTVTNQQITQKVHYWNTRHKISKEDQAILKKTFKQDKTSFQLLDKSYKAFVKETNRNKQKATDYKGTDFMKEFQKYIIDMYRNSVWGNIKGAKNAYPVIC